jgi:low affinity Fe/Cu permease
MQGTNVSDQQQLSDRFRALAETIAAMVGTYWAFMTAVGVVVIWAISGPIFGFSDTWQLVINTGTTIVTFLMVFLIQNTQNRDARVVALKLDELLRAVNGARTGMIDLDHMNDEELENVQKEFGRLREKYAPLVDDDLAHVRARHPAATGHPSRLMTKNLKRKTFLIMASVFEKRRGSAPPLSVYSFCFCF